MQITLVSINIYSSFLSFVYMWNPLLSELLSLSFSLSMQFGSSGEKEGKQRANLLRPIQMLMIVLTILTFLQTTVLLMRQKQNCLFYFLFYTHFFQEDKIINIYYKNNLHGFSIIFFCFLRIVSFLT